MEIIVEAFPFMFGVLLGLTCARNGRRRMGLWTLGSLALGALATLSTGEYRVSPLYFLLDIAIVGVVSLGAMAFVAWRRSGRR